MPDGGLMDLQWRIFTKLRNYLQTNGSISMNFIPDHVPQIQVILSRFHPPITPPPSDVSTKLAKNLVGITFAWSSAFKICACKNCNWLSHASHQNGILWEGGTQLGTNVVLHWPRSHEPWDTSLAAWVMSLEPLTINNCLINYFSILRMHISDVSTLHFQAIEIPKFKK